MPIAIDKPSKYFTAKTYTGTGATQSITGLEFSPDWVWTKTRSTTFAHGFWDNVRGATKKLSSNSTDAEVTESGLTAFNSDGFTLGSDAGANQNTGSYIAWCWDANGTGVSNTSGSITSTVSANTTSGFSIVGYTGTGANATVGHGLGVAPKMVIVKSRSNSTDWIVGNTNIGWTKLLRLNTTDAQETNNYFNDTAPTSSVFSLGTTVNVNGSGYTYVAYCFAEVKGFSKAFSYTGNGSSDGTFVYTGMRPAFIIVKRTDTTGTWFVFDNKRDTYNFLQRRISPNESSAEGVSGEQDFDFLSNGFKPRRNAGDWNASGGTYIGFAIAENPFVSSKGIPTTAR